jgi:formylglycine-generating enzyme required for sulfatase activity
VSKTRPILVVLVSPLVIFAAVHFARIWVWPFNYYYDYNLLKRSVTEDGCYTEHETVNHDLTLEEIDFTIRTGSGWKLGMFFSQNRNMDQLCERPRGILFPASGGNLQVYSIARLNEALKEENVEVQNIRDILRNFDLIGPILRANYYNDEIPRATAFAEAELRKYLWVYAPWKPAASDPHVEPLHSTETHEQSEKGAHGLPLKRIEYDVIALNPNGAIRERTTGNALCYLEGLGNGVTLDMVRIPSGQFLMGTSFDEATLVQAEHVRDSGEDFAQFWHEGPPHTVTVQTFYMGMFEVTQAQWRAVAKLPRINVDLPDDPSYFKGDKRPVESTSWRQTVEFCDRLSVATQRHYRLPTEAEWEYACRAGSATAYCYGNAITTEYSNYNGVYPYGSVGWGVHLGETTPVGVFGAPNAFGLYDMHGNVAELCADPWHDTYKGAPSDARIWTEGGNDYIHPVRGGCLFSTPPCLRAASRSQCYNPDNPCYRDGFRVVAVAGTR